MPIRKSFARVVLDVFTSRQGAGLPPESFRRFVTLNALLLTGVAACFSFGPYRLLRGEIALGVAELGAGLVVFLLLTLLRFRRDAYRTVATASVSLCGALFFFVVLRAPDTTVPLWLYVFPVLALFLLSHPLGWILSLALGLAVMVRFSLRTDVYDANFRIIFGSTYAIVTFFAAFFESVRRRTQARLQDANEELAGAQRKAESIFAHVTEGLFLIDETARIEAGHSAVLGSLLCVRSPAGRSLLAILENKLPRREVEGLRDYLEIGFRPETDEDLFLDLNPLDPVELHCDDGKGGFRSSTLSFRFSRLREGDRIARMLVTVVDVTRAAELEKREKASAERNRLHTETLLETVRVDPASFREFHEGATADLESLERSLEAGARPESFRSVFQALHSIKGNAQILGLRSAAHALHESESRLVALRDGAEGPSGVGSLTLLHELDLAKRALARLGESAELLRRFSRRGEMREASDPLRLLLDEFEGFVKEEAARRGREVVFDFELDPELVLPDAQRLGLRDAVGQLLRNSFAHGLSGEPSGRPLRIRLQGALSVDRKKSLWSYRDDGRGVDLDALRQKARQAGRIAEGLPDADLLQMIFEPDFSTREAVDATSGRGMGMAIVRETARRHGGDAKVASEKGRFFEVKFDFIA